jgi:hypothetical protein
VPVHYSAGALYRSRPASVTRSNSLAAWLVLIGLILPAWEMQISIADAKFTFGRAGVMLLLLPSLVVLCGRGRRLLISDVFAFAAAFWMLLAPVSVDGLSSLKSAGAVSVEFIAGYLAGRAFFREPAALATFVRVLKILLVTVILLAAADVVSGRWLSHDVAGALFGMPALNPVFRDGMIRATSTFDHPILFGTFCSLAAAILLFSESDVKKRFFYVGLCFVGGVLSQSSASLMTVALVLSAYGYNQLMRSVPHRWTIFWVAVASAFAALFLVSNRPLGWLITHLTLDPQTGYFRILIWDAALDQISQSPFVGNAFNLLGDGILDATTDSVWLVLALRFGLPIVILLALANVTALLPVRKQSGWANVAYMERMRLGFSIVLVLFMFTGLTVHFWNYIWIFWAVCIGIRASLRE